jgi:hypothetical protein
MDASQDEEPVIEAVPVQASVPEVVKKKRRGYGCFSSGCLITGIIVLVLLGAVWFFVRPGVFTFQPIGALPEA